MKSQPDKSNHDPGPWTEVSRTNGIRVVAAPDFETFSQFVNLGFGDRDCEYIWRGQAKAEWQISSSLHRAGRHDFSHLDNFRTALARVSDVEYDLSDHNPNAEQVRLSLWALGQHHGLMTPLIDWTLYPYAALFFAFIEQQGDGAFDRAVYALCWHEVSLINFHISETDGMKPFRDELEHPPYSAEFKQYLFDNFGFRNDAGQKALNESRISDVVRKRILKGQYALLKGKELHIHRSFSKDNRRIHNQGGLHVMTPRDVPLESWIARNQKHIRYPILVKILVPNSARTHVLRCLNKMNVNYMSLYSDIEGAAKHCNLALMEARLGMGIRDY